MKYVIALDQGTTSSRAVLFDQTGRQVASKAKEFRQIYPKPGWVEHDPNDILNTQVYALRAVVESSGIDVGDIEAIGITNQRETTLLWDAKSGKPVYNAIVWQCRRTASQIERLKNEGMSNVIRDTTGLIPDAYFSGTKLQWLLENIDGVRRRAENGELRFGTVDSFLVYNLTGKKTHVTDATNASRTMLFNLRTQDWDDTLIKALNIPKSVLPQVCDSSQVVGKLDKSILGAEIPIAAIAGDQNAALFGQTCFDSGMAKNTYGTGCFLLMNTGNTPVISKNGLLTTMAWRLNGQATFALEGSVFIGGAVVQWLRDELGLIKSAPESETLAMSVEDNAGVYLVPAFTGLGAPYWDMYARGTMVGLTRGANRAHIVRAALESIAFQTRDVIEAMAQDSGLMPRVLKVDGGASANNFLMQFQSDICGTEIVRPVVTETTALGAAMLAGKAIGMWDDEELRNIWKLEREFTPSIDATQREKLLSNWARAVKRSCGWEQAEQNNTNALL